MNKSQPVLRGAHILLRPLEQADATAMHASLNDLEVARLTGTHHAFSLADVQAFCARVAHETDRYDYIVCREAEPNVALGEMVLNDIDPHNHSANFRGALYDKNNFNRGIGTEAISLLMDFAFDNLKLNRVELEVYEFNERAIHVYQKLGFKQEGRRRQALHWAGEYHDGIAMSLLREDWRP